MKNDRESELLAELRTLRDQAGDITDEELQRVLARQEEVLGKLSALWQAEDARAGKGETTYPRDRRPLRVNETEYRLAHAWQFGCRMYVDHDIQDSELQAVTQAVASEFSGQDLCTLFFLCLQHGGIVAGYHRSNATSLEELDITPLQHPRFEQSSRCFAERKLQEIPNN